MTAQQFSKAINDEAVLNLNAIFENECRITKNGNGHVATTKIKDIDVMLIVMPNLDYYTLLIQSADGVFHNIGKLYLDGTKTKFQKSKDITSLEYDGIIKRIIRNYITSIEGID